jgi:hypothetical protein
MKVKSVHEQLSVKIHASGWMHQRILCERVEYLYGILTVEPFRNRQRCEDVAQANSVLYARSQRVPHLREQVASHGTSAITAEPQTECLPI